MTQAAFAEPGDRWLLLAIVIIGLLLRAVWIAQTQPMPLSDFKNYYDYAKAFYEGHLQYPIIIRHPGPSVLFAFAFFLLGPGLNAIWILNLILSAVMIIAAYALTRPLLGGCAALVSALITALLPTYIAYSAITASEIPSVVFLMVFLWGFFKLWRRDKASYYSWMGLGALLTGTVLIRSSSLLAMAVIPLMFLVFDRSQLWMRLKSYAVMALVLGIGLFSWMLHQHLVVGNGWKMYYGVELGFACALEPGNRQGAYLSPDNWSIYPSIAPYIHSERIADQVRSYDIMKTQIIEKLEANPGEYLANGTYRMTRVLRTSQTGIHWTAIGSPLVPYWPNYIVKRLSTISNVCWQILLLTSPVSLLAFFRRRKAPASWMGVSYFGLFAIAWIAFHWLMALSNERYAFQLAPFVVFLSIAGFTSLFRLICPQKETMTKEQFSKS